MAYVIGIGVLRKLVLKVNKNALLLGCSRNVAAWNKDWKPGPYPKTPEERAAAAKKYGLIPEDYVPYPDDGDGYGDYPKLPPISGEARDPYYAWDFPVLKKNYGEPLHVISDMLGEDRYNINAKPRFSTATQLMVFLGVMTVLASLFLLAENFSYVHPVMPKQYPGPGVKHYTFEPAE
ncbi:NADH dehydrogenase [ubiquinone] 1 beta subcomplex subunit 8, mitochondrial-like [Limulus polyphemus]|uniref:NADH dehydrogenase [ubiquinone] 1 beta subcomplex subunit 8, mitochondrial-like n=1 Tax=Limulus polyphemus TaxID=6850 RepID=A0ABM1B6P0_LIMPO|nr:NADH dehydrogenase [ubiquinone] 1 beta subcomplex subunit 8, mitochondrial-like [Limulus polyphemus]